MDEVLAAVIQLYIELKFVSVDKNYLFIASKEQ